jgi:hypothetical protein
VKKINGKKFLFFTIAMKNAISNKVGNYNSSRNNEEYFLMQVLIGYIPCTVAVVMDSSC